MIKKLLVEVVSAIIVAPFLGIPITIMSFWYQAVSSDCKRSCVNAPCSLPMECLGDLKAGFPLPVIHDDIGSSPIDGWGKIGVEDNFDFWAFFLNSFFYGVILIMLLLVIKNIFTFIRRSI